MQQVGTPETVAHQPDCFQPPFVGFFPEAVSSSFWGSGLRPAAESVVLEMRTALYEDCFVTSQGPASLRGRSGALNLRSASTLSATSPAAG